MTPIFFLESEFGSIPKNSELNPWSFQFWGYPRLGPRPKLFPPPLKLAAGSASAMAATERKAVGVASFVLVRVMPPTVLSGDLFRLRRGWGNCELPYFGLHNSSVKRACENVERHALPKSVTMYTFFINNPDRGTGIERDSEDTSVKFVC